MPPRLNLNLGPEQLDQLLARMNALGEKREACQEGHHAATLKVRDLKCTAGDPNLAQKRDPPAHSPSLRVFNVVAPEAAQIADIEFPVGDNRVGPRFCLSPVGLAGGREAAFFFVAVGRGLHQRDLTILPV